MSRHIITQRQRRALISALLSAVLALTLIPVAAQATLAPAPRTAATTHSTPPMQGHALSTALTPAKAGIVVNSQHLKKNESVRISGKVKASNGRAVVATVRIQYRAAGTRNFVTQRTVRTNSKGTFAQYFRPSKSGEWRIAVSGVKGVVSKGIIVRRKSGTRSLPSRTASLGSSALGSATTGTKKLSTKARKKVGLSGVTSVRYRDFRKGMIVETTRNGAKTSWFVHGKIAAAYRKAGGPAGSWGVPLLDAQCSLIENGCVQRFSRRTVYANNTTSATAVTAKGRNGEIIAAAASQIGYRKRFSNPVVQTTKYNNWAGDTRPWCALYLSWAANAAGHGNVIPTIGNFTTFKRTMGSTYRTGSTPKVGAVVILNGSGYRTHAAIVTGVKGSRVRILDGNTGYGSPAGYRGVNQRWVSRSSLGYYIYLS